jgi:pyrroloquinoline quinone (PQQ) biosynthesis protein C
VQQPSNSEVLWQKIRLAEPRLFSTTHLFWNHPDLARMLPEFLIQAHLLIRSGLALMSAAREQALALPGDDVARKLESYLKLHLEEEVGHDRWLLDDICSLGYEPQEVLQAPPCPGVVALVGAQYFWMSHIHPVAVMGYLILMEGYAPLVEQLDAIQAHTGLPSSAFRCLRAHADDDPGHLADLNATLDAMCLSTDQARAVSMCAFAAIDGVAVLLEDLLQTNAQRVDSGAPSTKEFIHALA